MLSSSGNEDKNITKYNARKSSEYTTGCVVIHKQTWGQQSVGRLWFIVGCSATGYKLILRRRLLILLECNPPKNLPHPKILMAISMGERVRPRVLCMFLWLTEYSQEYSSGFYGWSNPNPTDQWKFLWLFTESNQEYSGSFDVWPNSVRTI